MGIKLKEAKTKVKRIVKKNTFQDMLDYVKNCKLNLWGSVKGRNFEERVLVWTLYKDILGIGYRSLEEEAKSWMPLTDKSLRHNTRKMRKALSKWAEEKIILGDINEWNAAARKTSRTGKARDATLLLDSADVRLSGKRTTSKKSRKWSYKED